MRHTNAVRIMWINNKKTIKLEEAINSIVKPMKYWIVLAQDDKGCCYNWSNTDKLSVIEQLIDSISTTSPP